MCLHAARPAWAGPCVKQLQVICKPGLTMWDISCAGEHTSTRSRQLLWLQEPPCACSSRSSHMTMCWCSQLASCLPSTNCTNMTWIRPATLQQGWRNLSVSCKALDGRWEQPQSYHKTQRKICSASLSTQLILPSKQQSRQLFTPAYFSASRNRNGKSGLAATPLQITNQN